MVQLGNLEPEGKQTYVQIATLAVSSCMHLDKCSHFSKPPCINSKIGMISPTCLL